MSRWRGSRTAHVLIRVPLLRDLPLGVLEPFMQRVDRLRQLWVEYRARAAQWLRTGRAWRKASQRDGSDERWAPLLRRLLAPELLRLFFHPESILASQRPAQHAALRVESAPRLRATGSESVARSEPLRATVYCSREGNFFHAEMGELVALGLEASGRFNVRRQDEGMEPGESDLDLVVAPHEFFSLGAGSRFAGPAYAGFRRRCSLFLAEQPGTTHFVDCLPFAAEAARVLDLNAASAAALRRLGFDAHFFPVGYVKAAPIFGGEALAAELGSVRGMSLAAASAEDADPRPIDLLFTGVLTRRRAAFFSRHAEFFAERRCVLSLPTRLTPLQSGVASTLESAEAMALSQRSKIVLNVHRDASAYFEWHRVVIRGFWQQALVVSEPSVLPPGVVAGTHLFEATLDEMPELLRWLLDSPEGRQQAEAVRRAGHELLIREYDMRPWARGLAELVVGSARL